MYRNILIAVDGSAGADHALREAAQLAPADAALRLVTVVENPIWNLPLEHGVVYDVELLHTALVQAGRDILERARARLGPPGATADTRLLDLFEREGGIAAAIVAEAEAWPADVIVLGTHGRRGVRRLLLGSVAEDVLRRSRHPLLLVREPDDAVAGTADTGGAA